MASLQNILNPEESRRKSVKLVLNIPEHNASSPPEGPPSSPESPPPSEFEDSPMATFHQDYSHDPNHQPHHQCPNSLRCLPDTTDRPQHTLPVILRCAILGSPKQRLTIRDIYAAMEAKYIYYTTAGQTWKQSVRHHLSLNSLFERRERPATEPGFGSYWTVNLFAPPGTKRPRKRGPKKGQEPDAPRRKGGRPRTIVRASTSEDAEPQEAGSQEVNSQEAESPDTTLHPVQPSNDMEDVAFQSSPEASMSAYQYSYVWPPQCSRSWDDGRFDRVSSLRPVMDEPQAIDSEEDMPVHPMNRRPSLTGLDTYRASNLTQSPFTLPPIGVIKSSAEDSNLFKKMEVEMESLRQQSANAMTLSLELSQQLSIAQNEKNQMKSRLRDYEELLEEESQRRRRAEDALQELMSADEI